MQLSSSIRLSTLMWVSFSSAWAQIPQDKPELCGNADHSIPVPQGITAISWHPDVDLTINLRDGSQRTLELAGPDGIRQVCPLNKDRLLVFGSVPGDGAYIICILSQADGSILDVFGARDPRVSPDQHWLVYRKRYPTVVEVVYEEYLLYDLAKDVASNQAPGTTRQMRLPPGRLIFPITPNQYHRFASASFFWSPDSRFVVFGDRVGVNTSVVVVDVAASDLPVYLHGLSPSDICDGNGLGSEVIAGAGLSNVEFGTIRDGLPNLWAHFSFDMLSAPSGTTCTKEPLLHSGNLKRASLEPHKALKE